MIDENDKKISFLLSLERIMQDNYINNEVIKYVFYSVYNVILNNVQYNIKDDEYVVFILHLDELIVEICKQNDTKSTYSLPYCFIDDINIILKINDVDD